MFITASAMLTHQANLPNQHFYLSAYGQHTPLQLALVKVPAEATNAAAASAAYWAYAAADAKLNA
jgi:hypothetical protein